MPIAGQLLIRTKVALGGLGSRTAVGRDQQVADSASGVHWASKSHVEFLVDGPYLK